MIRPTAECIGRLTATRHVGLLATAGTVRSHSYELEIAKLHPDITVTPVACPMWVPLVETGEHNSPGADYFVQEPLQRLLTLAPATDAIILACTHYPLLLPKISQHTPPGIKLVAQGKHVAQSLQDYLTRHPDMERRLTRNASLRLLTTESPEHFDEAAARFLQRPVASQHIDLP